MHRCSSGCPIARRRNTATEASAGGRSGSAERCRQRRCACQCVLPDLAQRGRSALPRLRASGACAVVEGSGGAHRRIGLSRNDSAEQSRVRSRARRSRPCHRPGTEERPRVARARYGTDRARQIRRGSRRLSEALWTRARVLCLRLHGRDRQPHRQGAGCGGDARTRAGDRCRHTDGAARAWGESLLGEIAQRRGDAIAARRFQAALAADPRDLYTLGAYSDWLLDNRRAADVIPLVQNETRVDALLLRLALAQKALHRPEADASIATLARAFRRQPGARRRRAPARGVALPAAAERRCAGRAAARP